MTEDMKNAEEHLEELRALGIDLERIGQKLQNQSLMAFDDYFQSLINSVISKRDLLDFDWQGYEKAFGSSEATVESALDETCDERILCRIWSGDHTVWKPDPEEITNRIGWLHSVEVMRANEGRLDEFGQSLKFQEEAVGPIKDVVVLGMGGSSLAAELFGVVFGGWRPAHEPAFPELSILDTTDPDVIAGLAERLDLESTLFIVSSKSGGTVETLSAFKYFYNLLIERVGTQKAGRYFVAITDPGTSLSQLAKKLGFRDIFLNDPNIGGRYSVLSFFGLVPAVAAGVDIPRLLDNAFAMAVNTHSCNCPFKGDNVAAQFGTAMGALANEGRDKVTIITSAAVAPFADWAEQLIAESTGKEGKGILPVVGEPIASPEFYGDDRFFVFIRLEGDASLDQGMKELRDAGLPVVTFHLKDVYDLGGLFFIWEMATAVASTFLEINPFDQPNVEEAKKLAKALIAQYRDSGGLPDAELTPPSSEALLDFFARIKPGGYAALQAYIPASAAADEQLGKLRTWISKEYKIATTMGYGPRYLHSTGQLHKGDAGNGLFIQFTSDSKADIPIPSEAGSSETDITFAALKQAQALGDASALRKARRRIVQFHLGDDVAGELKKLVDELEAQLE